MNERNEKIILIAFLATLFSYRYKRQIKLKISTITTMIIDSRLMSRSLVQKKGKQFKNPFMQSIFHGRVGVT